MGINDLATTDPDLAKEYVYEKNPPLDQLQSHEKVWWRCPVEGHPDYEQSKSDRQQGKGCPVCGHVKLIPGVNDLATISPELLLDWDYLRNDRSPSEVFAFSNKEAYWKCHVCGHEWKKKIGQRQSRGCPACAGQVLVKGKNDLASQRPDLLEEWDYEKNNVKPDEVFVTSNIDAHWKCEHGHRYSMKICDKSKSGCPICSNQRIVPGINDLATLRPDLAAEWDYEHNDRTPEEVGTGSGYKAYWICSKNSSHTWRTRVVDRKNGKGCPHCAKRQQTSKQEQAVYLYIKKMAPDAVNRYKISGNKEVDIFIPSLNIAVEYDGSYYHIDKEKDLQKDEICASKGIQLYRIREPGLPRLNSTSIEIYRKGVTLGSGLDEAIKILINNIFNVHIDVDTKGLLCEILNDLQNTTHPRALSEHHPILAVQWDYDENDPLTPEQVSYSVRDKFWWLYPSCGHQWQAAPHTRSRATRSYGRCPDCGHVPILPEDISNTNI